MGDEPNEATIRVIRARLVDVLTDILKDERINMGHVVVALASLLADQFAHVPTNNPMEEFFDAMRNDVNGRRERDAQAVKH